MKTSERWIAIRAGTLMTLAALFVGCGATEDRALALDEIADDDSGSDTPIADLPEPTLWRADPPALSTEEIRRQREVERHLAERYRGQRIVETTQTYVGDIIDWFDPTTVPGAQAEPPPRPSPEELKPPPGTQLQLTELDLYPELRGPEGTIPVVRPRFEAYVRGETTASSFDAFVRRELLPGPPPGQKRLYAGIASVATNTAIVSWVNEFGGAIEAGTFSILEMATVCPGLNPSTTHEQVGVAIGRDRKHFSDSLVRLRVEFLTMGEQTGPNIGGWDGSFSGFIPAAGRPYGPNITLIPSTVGGSQSESRIDILLSGGNWWVGHNGNWLGYYPGSLFNEIASWGCEAHWYGEVYDPTPADWTWTNMGSGLFAASGHGQAAHFRNPYYKGLWGFTYWPTNAGNTGPNDVACYTRTNLLSGASPWDYYFFLGGPGGDAAGCN